MITNTPAQNQLRDLSPDDIHRNPDNPRLFFRPEEMDTLLASIRRFGIQVPITVYKDGDHYVLIDGERRWRSAKKLNLPKIPALIQPKPTELNNLLLMFNIHALREQWDYLTIANKLPDVIRFFSHENSGREPNEIELSELTGLTRGQIRRCRFLLDLPDAYRIQLEKELALPKSLQRLSEDFFIEMERALKTVNNRIPSAIPDLDSVRDVLIQKFRDGVIGNITDFRKLSKIATSTGNIGVKEFKAKEALDNIFNPNSKSSIHNIFAEQFEIRYDSRKVSLNIDSIYEFLDGTIESEGAEELDENIKEKLQRLKQLIDRILGEYHGV